jgi:putative PEP-CTERM system TPR-repeat lipoprotein
MSFVLPRIAFAARAAALCLAALLVAGCGSEPPEKLLASAKEYLAKGDRNAAVIQLKNLLTRAPNNGEARLLLGEALLETEDFASAEKELARALELKQPQEKVLPAYARALLAQGKSDAVVAEVQKYRLFNPDAVAVTQTALGDAYVQLGNAARARDAYAAAMAAKPGHPRARLGEARLLAVEGKLDESLQQIDAALAADPKLAESFSLRAEILLAKGDPAGAKKALGSAIEAQARFLPARVLLIALLMEERDYDAAAKLIDSTRRVAPNSLRVTYLDASLAFRRGDYDRARQQVQQVLKYLPEDVDTLVLAGRVELQARQYAAAETHLRKALSKSPNQALATLLLVQTYLQAGQPSRAKDLLQPYVDSGLPDDQRLQLLAGETYLANGDFKRASEFYQAAAKWKTGIAPQALARTRLGQMALTRGDAEGFKQLEAASELDPEAYQADLSIIAWHLVRNEVDKAMAAVAVLEKKQPNNPLTFQMYGLVNLAKRDHAAARKSFDKALELDPKYLPAANRLSLIDVLEKKPDDARKRYEAMIRAEPENASLYMAMADLQQRTEAPAKDVLASFQRAVKAAPQLPEPRVALINYLLRSGETKAALSAAQEALATMPSDRQVLEVAGIAQEAAGEINQAIETYNKLGSLQPNATRPLYRLASLYVRQKDHPKAIETLQRVQKIARNDRDVVPQLVQVYVMARRYEDALREARGLQKREPNSAGGWALEGDVHLAQLAFTGAERMYRQALKLDPKANAVAGKLYAALYSGGKRDEADAWSRKWLAENPKDAEMRLFLGDRELGARNFKAAAAHFQAAVAIQPNNALALNNLAWIGSQTGDPRAIEYAARAAELAPQNAEVLDTYGTLLVEKGEIDRGMEILDRAGRIAPGRNDLRLSRAKALLKAGRKDEARKELESLKMAKGNYFGKDEVEPLLKSL